MYGQQQTNVYHAVITEINVNIHYKTNPFFINWLSIMIIGNLENRIPRIL